MRRFLVGMICAGVAFAPGCVFAQATTNYSYDDLGRLKTVTSPSGTTYTTTYNYDAVDNRTSAASHAGVNRAPVCPDIVITQVLAGHPHYFTPPFGTGCSDADGDPMTATPAPPTVYLDSNFPETLYSFTVSDGQGGSTPAKLTLKVQ